MFLVSRDIDNVLGEKLDDFSLFNMCKCGFYRDENFWMNRVINKFSKKVADMKLESRSWKEFYTLIVYYDNKYLKNKALKKVSKRGMSDLVNFFIDKGAIDFYSGAYNAAKGGHTELVNFFTDKTKESRGAVKGAAIGNHLDLFYSCILKIHDILIKGDDVSERHIREIIEGAARGGNKEIIDYVLNLISNCQNKEYLYDKGMAGAARAGDLDLVNFFMEKGNKEPSSWSMGLKAAARGGHMYLVNFFIEKGAKYGITSAAKGGHFEIVDHFLELTKNRKDMDIQKMKGAALHGAAEGGHLEMVENYISQGFMNSENVKVGLMGSALQGGYKKVIDLVTPYITSKGKFY